jgi:protease II
MGAIANMAPADYAGIVAGVPFVDVVTTMLDESIPLTSNEFDEWGNPKDKKFYDYMLAYSPYAQLGPHDYPAMFLHSGLWDSQVQSFEPTTYVARFVHGAPVTAWWCCAPTWKPAMAASPAATSTSASTQQYAFILDQAGIRN